MIRFYSVALLGLLFFSAASAEPISNPKHDDGINRLAISSDGKIAAIEVGRLETDPAIVRSSSIQIWELTRQKPLIILKRIFGHTIWDRQFSPDGRYLATTIQHCSGMTTRGGALAVWDTKTGKQLFWVRAPRGASYHVAYSPDGATIATLNSASSGLTTPKSSYIYFWDAKTGRLKRALPSQANADMSLVFSPDSKNLIVAGVNASESKTDSVLCVYDTRSGELRHRTDVPTAWLAESALSPDGRYLATRVIRPATVRGEDVYLWDTRNWSWKVLQGQGEASGPTDSMQDLAWSRDSRDLSTLWTGIRNPGTQQAAAYAYAKVWRIQTNRADLLASTPLADNAWPYPAVLNPNGSRIFGKLGAADLTFWDVLTGKLEQQFTVPDL